MNQTLFGVMLACVAVAACATKRLPAGTPPPEYEMRAFPSWPPASAQAGAAGAPSSAGASYVPAEAVPGASAAPSAGKTTPAPSPPAAGE
jgi:hypothetical protein